MDIMKKRISLILSVILLALAIVPIVNVNATSNTCQVSVETKMGSKKLQNNSRYKISGGEKVTVRSSSTKAEIEFITHYFVTKELEKEEPTRTERYKDRDLKKVGTNNQGYGIYESTIIIPKNPAGTLVNLMVEPVAANDDGSENTITKTGWQKYILEYVSDKEPEEDTYTKKINVSYETKTLSNKSTTVVKAGDTVLVTAKPADKVTKIAYAWNGGAIQTVSKDELEFEIPIDTKAGTYKFMVNAMYEDGLYVDDKVASKTTSQTYYFKIEEKSNTEYTKKLEVSYNGEILANKSTTVVKAGEKIVVKVTPANKVSKIIYSWNGETVKSVAKDTFEFTIPADIEAGTYKFVVNAMFEDGLYVDGEVAAKTVSKAYTFTIKDDSKPSNNRDLDIEPWMEENDETEELSISLRNDSEEEDKANKNIYALNEVVTYYIDYKNGGKDIDDATITLELPIDFKVVDLDGGKINDDDEIEWTFDKGLEEDEAGTIIVKVKYTDLKKSRDDANTIYPTAKIYKGSKVKDVSTVINFIIRDYDEEIDIEHEPYMYGDADSDTFRPDYVITRAEGALVLARIYGLDYTKIKESEITTKYTDIDATYFEAQQAITAASKAGLINGFLEDDGTYTYRPNTLMTKAQFMKILACMIQEGANDEDIDGLEIKGLENLVKIYDDAEKYYLVEGKRVYTHWAIEEITLLARLNMLPLTEDESYFKLDETITRAEVAQLINFYLLRAPAEVTSKTKTGFSDVSRKHKLVGDIVEATRKSHTFSITDEATEVEE